ncbi:unnamed protein product [Bursaphelenchus okinawaensis]|uniref:Uncharacterized protein n=1 Tax=Bursaphelenchus okinawaensis TaxID=465554 RepID=A0A811LVG8_9BILA|nr:unnamed protein product [Bursaphelenchus okinawaensis]CAG9128374.1 unnamed protein product [Bursaphelenchus okinawaensis]
MTQRTNCDENTMPPDDQQLFNLLQLRLSRTEMFLKDHNGTNPQDFFHVPGGLEEIPTPTQDSFRDEVLGGDLDEVRGVPQFTHRISSQIQERRNDLPPPRDQSLVTRSIIRQPNALRTPRANANSLRTSTDRFRRHEFEEEIPSNVPKARLPVIYPVGTNDRVDLGESAILNGGSGTQPTTIISRQGSRFRAPSATVPFGTVPQRIRTAFGVPQRINTRLNGVTNTRDEHDNHNHELEPANHNHERPPPRRSTHFSEAHEFPIAGSNRYIVNKPETSNRVLLSTNSTRETVPRAKHFTVSNSPAYRQSNDDLLEEKPMKSSLSIRKLHLGNVRKLGGFAHATSYGGSFATSAEQAIPTTRNLRTFNNLTPVRPVAKGLTGPQASNSEFTSIPSAPKAQAFIPNRVFSIEDVQPQPIRPQTSLSPQPTHYYNNSVYRPVGFANTVQTVAPPTPRPLPQPPVETPLHLNPSYRSQLEEVRREHEFLAQQQQKEANLRGLLQCCQDQAPGCRHLCSPDVSKEEVLSFSFLALCYIARVHFTAPLH